MQSSVEVVVGYMIVAIATVPAVLGSVALNCSLSSDVRPNIEKNNALTVSGRLQQTY